ncbi:MAG: ribonucleoside-diphosphate reductase [Microgenomates group bacterium Gr01-1014_80]|nr:MAG: ribonucleoside-diphosphate reductase [Microgenomates group bacterium Gr01-1014_80]
MKNKRNKKDKPILQLVSVPKMEPKKTNGRANGYADAPGVNFRTFETRFEPRYKKMPDMPYGLPEPSFSESSNKILKERYLLKGGDLEAVETVAERFWHIAYDIASADFDFGADPSEVTSLAKKFYEFMVKQEFLPNSPTIMNAGKQNQLQYSACFVLPVGDSIPEIFETMKYAALIHQTGGGTGFAFSRLRPAGSVVKRSGGVASGPVSFLRVYDAATQAIKQGGTRRGANMGILRIDHPDILEFIRSKAELDEQNKPVYDGVAEFLPEDKRALLKTLLLDRQISNFNISAAMTDKFMDAYYKNKDYDLIDPHTEEVTGQLNAKDVLEEMVRRAWATGDPGCIFIDRINNSPANPVPSLGLIESTNPCVTGDAWVHTSNGPRQVYNLIGSPFMAQVDGRKYLSGDKGFFSTGEKRVFNLQTQEGYTLRLTADHRVRRITKLTRYTSQTDWVETKDLKEGDKLVLNNHRSNNSWPGNYSFTDGYLMGLLIGDGTLKKDKAVLSVWQPSTTGSGAVMSEVSEMIQSLFPNTSLAHWMGVSGRNEYRFSKAHIKHLAEELGMSPGKKRITPTMEQSSSEFYKGLLRGLFDTDGSVQGTQLKGVSVRLAQSDLECLKTVQRLLLRLGIVSCIYQNRRPAGYRQLPNGKGGKSKYYTKAQHELVVSGDNLLLFQESIGFKDSVKALRLKELLKDYKRILNRERFFTIVSKVKADGIEEVYDVQVPTISAFDANGLYVHNCGEQPLWPWDACNLGSINLGKTVLPDGSGVDWESLREAVRKAVHFLDNVVQTNPYTVEQIYDQVHKVRRIGLGVMGWADMLFKLKIAYNSDEALALGEKVMKFINDEGHKISEELAEVRGPFPLWSESIYAGKNHPSFKGRDDCYAYSSGKPIRNSTVTTIAPTGTISIIADCSSGIEPVFALAYIHRAKGDGGKTGMEMRYLTIANQSFEAVSKEQGFWSEDLAKKVMDHGSVTGIDDVPSEWQKVFVTAGEIEPEWHVKMQAAFQKFTDNAVSKTINLPNWATVDDVRRAYLMAWETGCNGITVYRDGSKTTQVLNVSSTLKPKTEESVEQASQDTVVSRPMVLRGRTYKMQTPVGEGFITINRDSADQPFEVFVTIGKGGMHTMADAEAMGRLVSLSLKIARSSKAVDPKTIAQKIVSQLRGIGGASTVGFGKSRVMSLADAIAKALSEDLAISGGVQDESIAEPIPLDITMNGNSKDLASHVDLCPECGQATFVFEEGCKKCYSCGYSMC